MSFLVSARKYRPIRFEDVVGQEHVAQTLKNALRNDKLAHAFLFCGPRGVGKTTCARILAKVLNCQNAGKEFEPCNTCDNCRAFNENASFNIIELDAASNNSVEHIRTLIEQVRFQPQQGKYKVFIIDEVHMLSQAAFNAFLKTLEEPPSYAVFILATTEKHKILPTILSRCQIFDFKRIGIPEIVAHLQEICKKEKLKAEPEALHIIAQKADGALRDALSIFDRMASTSDGKITYEAVIQNLNVLDYDYFFRITDALLAEDLPQVLLIFDQIQKNGFESEQFITGLAEHFRNLLVSRDEETLQLLETSQTQRNRYLQQATIAPAAFILAALNIAVQCDLNLKMARNRRLLTETALIKITYLNRMVDVTKKEVLAAAVSEKKMPESKTIAVLPVEKAKPEIFKPTPEVVKTVAEAVPPKPVFESKLEKETPSLKGGLAAIEAEVSNEKTADQAEPSDISLENLAAAWAEYANKKDNHIKSVLDSAVLELKGHKIVATVGSTLAKNTLHQEIYLMEHLRKTLKHNDLVWEIVIDESKIIKPAKAPKPLTNKEKFQKMLEVNPLVKDVVEKFDLQLED